MNYKLIKAVIFDLDGTLIDSMSVWGDADRQFVEKYGGIYNPEISQKLKSMTIEQASSFLISVLNLRKNVSEVSDEIADIVAYQYKNTIPLKPDVISITDFLKKNNIPFCIATATFRKLAEAILKRYKIYERFEFVLTGEDVPEGKKSPAIYLKCSEMMGVLPSETLVVEDSLHCIETSVRAGFPTVAIYDEFSKNDWKQIENTADRHIYRLDEIKNIIL